MFRQIRVLHLIYYNDSLFSFWELIRISAVSKFKESHYKANQPVFQRELLQEPSVGAHRVAFLQLLYNVVKSPQDNPLDSYSHFIARYRFRRRIRSLIVSLKAHVEDRMQSERRKAQRKLSSLSPWLSEAEAAVIP